MIMINNRRSLLELTKESEHTQTVQYSMNTPVRIKILSTADNTPLLHNELDHILLDATNCREYSTYVDNEGITQVTIECISIKEEARYALEKLRSKNVSH
jgi:hypothetical protein